RERRPGGREGAARRARQGRPSPPALEAGFSREASFLAKLHDKAHQDGLSGCDSALMAPALVAGGCLVLVSRFSRRWVRANPHDCELLDFLRRRGLDARMRYRSCTARRAATFLLCIYALLVAPSAGAQRAARGAFEGAAEMHPSIGFGGGVGFGFDLRGTYWAAREGQAIVGPDFLVGWIGFSDEGPA